MTASIKGTETEKNLLKSFAGESQARNRYTYFASVARKEGYRQIAEIFEETADQESQHAKRMFKFLEGGCVEITATYPAGKIGETTLENLQASAAGEEEEWTELYPAFAETADKEGFPAVASMYRMIAIAEKQHGKRFADLAANVEAGTVFKKAESTKWRCINCGYVHEGEEAVGTCPACIHPQSHFEILGENW